MGFHRILKTERKRFSEGMDLGVKERIKELYSLGPTQLKTGVRIY